MGSISSNQSQTYTKLFVNQTSYYFVNFPEPQKYQDAYISEQQNYGLTGKPQYYLQIPKLLKYSGQMLKSQINDQFIYDGVGKLQLFKPKKMKYEGRFKNGYPQGQGQYETKNICYYGTFKNGLFEGYGTIQFKHPKQKYQGQFRAGQRHGKGIYLSDSFQVKGQWVEDRIEGLSVISICDKFHMIYQGQTKQNRLQGYGRKQIFKQIIHQYMGYFKQDQFDGFGVYKYGPNLIYIGEWSQGKKNGQGILIEMGQRMHTKMGIFENDKIIEYKQVRWQKRKDQFLKQPYKYYQQENPLKNIEQIQSIQFNQEQSELYQLMKNRLQLILG